eukprot:139776-Pelagomonas_calceolata.AAC.3
MQAKHFARQACRKPLWAWTLGKIMQKGFLISNPMQIKDHQCNSRTTKMLQKGSNQQQNIKLLIPVETASRLRNGCVSHPFTVSPSAITSSSTWLPVCREQGGAPQCGSDRGAVQAESRERQAGEQGAGSSAPERGDREAVQAGSSASWELRAASSAPVRQQQGSSASWEQRAGEQRAASSTPVQQQQGSSSSWEQRAGSKAQQAGEH